MATGGLGQVAILSAGVWKLRDAVQEITGLKPVRWLPPLQRPKFGCVVGWGLKPTSHKARELSRTTDADFIALEDGFLRSVYPGPETAPLSLVMDRKGIHYDATAPSDLEDLIASSATNFDASRLERARNGINLLRHHALSKYNHARRMTAEEMGLAPSRRQGRVLVVDQTAGDCSISYGLADESSFARMMAAARAENPGAEIVLKIHPEVVSGKKRGHLAGHIGSDVHVIDYDVNPWSLFEQVDKVYVVTSQLGLEALLANKQVICFGAPFYAGWGLTDDKAIAVRRSARPTMEQLFAALYLDYCAYLSPETKRRMSFEVAVERLVEQRQQMQSLDAEGW